MVQVSAAGKPRGTPSLGSYEPWSKVMGGILEVAGIPGLLSNRDRVYRQADEEVMVWEEFVAVWWQACADKLVAVEQLFGLATRGRLLAEVWGGRTEQGGRIGFGKALSQMRDRMVGG